MKRYYVVLNKSGDPMLIIGLSDSRFEDVQKKLEELSENCDNFSDVINELLNSFDDITIYDAEHETMVM